jgi:hypothetical protein
MIKGEGENLNAKGSTLDLARTVIEKFSVPPSIIGRMVATPPDKIYWLNRSDLAEMGVQIIDDKPTVQQPPAPAPSPEPPVTHTRDRQSTIRYDANEGARKAQSPSSTLCPPPYRMTASDGSQK